MPNSLIKIKSHNMDGYWINSVDARDLHNKLNSTEKFTKWLKRFTDKKDFIEGVDYIYLGDAKVTQSIGYNKKISCILSLDMAKHIAMMSQTQKGRDIRQYFIDIEKQYNRILVNKASETWNAARLNGKVIRLHAVDAILRLIELAEKQTKGKTKARKRYHSSFTQMEYRVLFFVAESLPKPNSFRDLLDELQLSQLATAEGLIANKIHEIIDIKETGVAAPISDASRLKEGLNCE